jgi:acetyl-CoA carboxylase biotin carboxyl carrier protein
MSELSFTEVGEILALIENLDADYLDIDYGGMSLRIRRNGHTESPAPEVAEDAAQEPVPEPSPVVDSPAAQDWHAVTAPMVGTYYRAPSPEEPPFVREGDTVEIGQIVGLIEVMKLFTELRADVAGTVARLDVADGTLVEYAQPLLWLSTKGLSTKGTEEQ